MRLCSEWRRDVGGYRMLPRHYLDQGTSKSPLARFNNVLPDLTSGRVPG
jgi:hypothetical protein